MKKYDYTGVARFGVITNQVAGFSALVIALFGSIGLPIYVIEGEGIGDAAAMSTLGCLSIWILLVMGSVGMGLINSYPTIWIGDDHLEISAFIFARVRIAWSDIIDVGAGRVPWGFVLVRAWRITVFHRLYGWQYSRSLVPGFVIGPQIENHDQLIQEIKHRSRHANGPRR